jgi:outer membrane protein OmpA-like peptidoglycan-associated protein
MKNILSLVAGGLLGLTTLQAQVVPPARFGGFASFGLSQVSPSIQIWRGFGNVSSPLLPFVNDTTRFLKGSTGLGVGIGIMGGVPLGSMVHLTGRLGYSSLSGTATATQTGSPSDVSHDLNVFMSTLEISPTVEFYGLFGEASFHPLVGLELGLPLATSITQRATPTEGDVVTFAENADFPEPSVRAALMLGMAYTIRVNRSWYVQPEISYRAPLTNVSSAASFSPTSFSQLRIGINVFFGASEPIEDIGPDAIQAYIDSVTAAGRDARSRVISSIILEDVRYTEMMPLVPYVFAAEGGIPDASMQATDFMAEKGMFDPTKLPFDAVEANRNLLNIVGSRMRALPHANLFITGTTDGSKVELGTKDLPELRANWAKNYLVTGFGIDAARIKLSTSATPAKPSSITVADGVAENRRIELTSDVPNLLEPVIITAENERIPSTDLANFHTRVTNTDSVASWTFTLMQGGRILSSITGAGRPTTIPWSIKKGSLAAEELPIDYELIARSPRGDSAVTTGSLGVEYLTRERKRTSKIADQTVDKYSLVLFEFDKATMTAENRRILEQMVLPNITSNSEVTILGYTDRIGNDDHNFKLSMERAEAVRAFLSSRAKDATYVAEGVGEAGSPYSNDIPVGRQLNRTVQVIVKTPRR